MGQIRAKRKGVAVLETPFFVLVVLPHVPELHKMRVDGGALIILQSVRRFISWWCSYSFSFAAFSLS